MLVHKILLLTALSQVFAIKNRQNDGDPPPRVGDPGEIEYSLKEGHRGTLNATKDIIFYRGNSTNLDDALDNIRYATYNAGDGAYFAHLGGVLSRQGAQEVCKYINTTLVRDNKLFLATAVVNKKKFDRYKYTSSLIDHLNEIVGSYDSAYSFITSASYYGGSEACNDADKTIDTLFSSAVAKLSK